MQLLQNLKGFVTAFNLAPAPLGLLSIVTSLIRLCGIHLLRAFIGRELEARLAAAVEMTRVNCNGVQAQLVDGYIVRRVTNDSAKQVAGATLLGGACEIFLTRRYGKFELLTAWKKHVHR